MSHSHRLELGTKVVWTKQGLTGVVTRADGASCTVAFSDGRTRIVPVDELSVNRDVLGSLLHQSEGNEPRDFLLSLRARLLLYDYRFGGKSWLSNSRLDLYPHQVFVVHKVASEPNPRFLLADEPGLGKTIEAGLVVKELLARDAIHRVLIVTPADLTPQWQYEMQVKVGEEFEVFDAERVGSLRRTRPGCNPWARTDRVICSLQYARREEQADEIVRADWDLVIFDEAHHLRAQARSSYSLAKQLAEKAPSALFLTATPMQLNVEEFYDLLHLVDPVQFWSAEEFEKCWRWRTAYMGFVSFAARWPECPPEQQEHALGCLVRLWGLQHRPSQSLNQGDSGADFDDLDWLVKGSFAPSHEAAYLFPDMVWRFASHALGERAASMENADDASLAHVFQLVLQGLSSVAADVLRSDTSERDGLSAVMIRNRKRKVLGDSLPPRHAHLLPVDLTDEELDLYEAVTGYLRREYAAAQEQNERTRAFRTVIMQRMLASSTAAAMASLKRRKAWLEESLRKNESRRAKREGGADMSDDDHDGIESAEDLDFGSDNPVLADPEGVREEINVITGILEMGSSVSADSKANILIQGLHEAFDVERAEGRSPKALVFTHYYETLWSLERRLEDEGFSVCLFHGRLASEKKDDAVREFRDNAQVMLSTEAGGEGRNFQFCHLLFNYDLPWNPMRVEQRIGRVDRIGQQHAVHVFNLHAPITLEGRIVEVLQARLGLFESTVGQLDPVLGEEIEETIEHILFSPENADERIEDMVRVIEQRKRDLEDARAVLDDFIMDSNSFRIEDTEAILAERAEEGDVRSQLQTLLVDFVERYPTGAVSQAGDSCYDIHLPAAFRDDCKNRLGISELPSRLTATFSREKALNDDRVELMAFGHPVFDAIVTFCSEPEKHNRFAGRAAALQICDTPFRGASGFLLAYETEFYGVTTTKRLHLLWEPVQAAGVCEDDVVRLVRTCPIEKALELPNVPDCARAVLADAADSAAERAQRLFEQDLQDLTERNSRDLDKLRHRAQTLFDYRRKAAQVEIDRIAVQLDTLRKSERPEDHQVLPAWQGQLDSQNRRLQSLQTEYEQRLQELEHGSNPATAWSLVAAAYLQFT